MTYRSADGVPGGEGEGARGGEAEFGGEAGQRAPGVESDAGECGGAVVAGVRSAQAFQRVDAGEGAHRGVVGQAEREGYRGQLQLERMKPVVSFADAGTWTILVAARAMRPLRAALGAAPR